MPEVIVSETRAALDDVKYWHAQEVYEKYERAIRLHCRLVTIHPFPNGNGRCSRLIADLYLVSIGEPLFTWGSRSTDGEGWTREHYSDALMRALTEDNFGPLITFARS